MLIAPPNRTAAALRTIWLRRIAAASGWHGHAAGWAQAADGLAAIGFAAGIALSLTTLPQGMVAVMPWLGLALACAFARGGCALATARLGASASAKARATLRREIIIRSLGLAPDARPQVGEMLTTAVDAVEALDGYIARFLPARRAAGIVPLLILVATAAASPFSAAILAATMLPFIVLMVLAGGAAADEQRRQLTTLGRLSGLFADRVRSLPLLLAFQSETAEAGRLAASANALRASTMAVLRVAFISSAGLEFFAALAVALVAVYAGFNLLGLLPFPAPEHLDLAHAIFVLALAPEFYLPMRRLAAAYHDRQAAESAADRLMELEALRQSRPCAAPAFDTPPPIRFDAVSIRYPGEAHPVVDDFTLDIAPGEIVALMGPSGSGKTSLLNLLLGLAPLAGGEVWIGDLALSEVSSVANATAWAGQSPVIIADSIGANIALSRRTAAPEDIIQAADAVGLRPMLSARPDGLDSRLDERGSGLSGGERRRLGLARALLKNAPILLLDEPTAHLDAAAEADLIEAIRVITQRRGATTLIATHSEALAGIADRIVRISAA